MYDRHDFFLSHSCQSKDRNYGYSDKKLHRIQSQVLRLSCSHSKADAVYGSAYLRLFLYIQESYICPLSSQSKSLVRYRIVSYSKNKNRSNPYMKTWEFYLFLTKHSLEKKVSVAYQQTATIFCLHSFPFSPSFLFSLLSPSLPLFLRYSIFGPKIFLLSWDFCIQT